MCKPTSVGKQLQILAGKTPKNKRTKAATQIATLCICITAAVSQPTFRRKVIVGVNGGRKDQTKPTLCHFRRSNCTCFHLCVSVCGGGVDVVSKLVETYDLFQGGFNSAHLLSTTEYTEKYTRKHKNQLHEAFTKLCLKLIHTQIQVECYCSYFTPDCSHHLQ